MFSEDALKCHAKRHKPFFNENMDLSKKLFDLEVMPGGLH